ncbi:MAG: hypothetical protein WDM96_01925 [Lacunisphaera sp.]
MNLVSPRTLVNRLIALTLLLLVFAGTLGLGAVWMRGEISRTANRSRALAGQLTDVERRLDEVNAQVAAAVNPDALLRQGQFMNLALASPRELQVMRVDESPELRLAAKRNREVFSLATAALDGSAGRNPSFRVVTASLR